MLRTYVYPYLPLPRSPNLTPHQDSERLPEGFKRTGYDADTQKYTFVDASGRTYESSSGNRYGVLRPVGGSPSSNHRFFDDVESPTDPFDDSNEEGRMIPKTFDDIDAHNQAVEQGNKEAVRTMLPFALLVLVVLLVIFRFLYSGSNSETVADESGQVHCAQGYHEVQVEKGQTCWEFAEGCGLGVEEWLGVGGNEGIDCDKLEVGRNVCVKE